MILVKYQALVVASILAAGLWFAPQPVLSQEDADGDSQLFEKQPPDHARRGKGGARNPDRLQQRLERVRNELEELRQEDPDSHRVAALEEQVEHLEMVLDRMQRSVGRRGPRARGDRDSHFGSARRGGPGGPPPPYSEEQMIEFLEEHEELGKLFEGKSKSRRGKNKFMRKPFKRHDKQLREIMAAYDSGAEELGDKMIDSAKIQFRISPLLRQYREAPEGSEDRDVLREEIAALVQSQVSIDLQVRELELEGLRQRLAKQQKKIEADWDRQDEIAGKKLERILSRSARRERGAEGRSERKSKRRGRPRWQEEPDNE